MYCNRIKTNVLWFCLFLPTANIKPIWFVPSMVSFLIIQCEKQKHKVLCSWLTPWGLISLVVPEDWQWSPLFCQHPGTGLFCTGPLAGSLPLCKPIYCHQWWGTPPLCHLQTLQCWFCFCISHSSLNCNVCDKMMVLGNDLTNLYWQGSICQKVQFPLTNVLC